MWSFRDIIKCLLMSMLLGICFLTCGSTRGFLVLSWCILDLVSRLMKVLRWFCSR